MNIGTALHLLAVGIYLVTFLVHVATKSNIKKRVETENVLPYNPNYTFYETPDVLLQLWDDDLNLERNRPTFDVLHSSPASCLGCKCSDLPGIEMLSKSTSGYWSVASTKCKWCFELELLTQHLESHGSRKE